jgi:spore coat protein U-like protein
VLNRVTLCVLGLVAMTLPFPKAASQACEISATPIDFGSYSVFAGSPLDSTGSVKYSCLSNLSKLTIGLSTGGSNSFDPRALTSGSRNLNYNIFLDAGYSTIWGDGTSGTSQYEDSSVVPGQQVTVTMYGRIPAMQNVPSGNYSDTLAVTIEF